MKVTKRENSGGDNSASKVSHYYKYKTAGMVFIKGNFFRGGFSLSKNKVKAVIDNIDELKRFVSGEYDEKIMNLAEDEILELE